MTTKSKAFHRAIEALQQSFPTLIVPFPSPGETLFEHLEHITSQLRPSCNMHALLQQMKSASDAQQYRLQRKILQMDRQIISHYQEEICYELHSTAMMPQSHIFQHHQTVEDHSSLLDDVWWNAEKKMESLQYFLE